MNEGDLEHIEYAVRVEAYFLSPEDRFDLRQELVIKLLERKEPPEDAKNWLLTCAKNWVANFLRDEKRRRELLSEMKKTGALRPLRQGECWEPKWYAPSKTAQEYSPFACAGARLMHCSETPSCRNHYENLLVQYLDFIRVWKKDSKLP